MAEAESMQCDVLIVGSGPIGCGIARTLLDPTISELVPREGGEDALKQLNIVIVDIGQYLSDVPGENMKNSYYYQRNVNNFTPIVQGTMQPISIAPNSTPLPYPSDPNVFQVQGDNYIINNINPDQDEHINLPSAATTYAIGGMATHWTCCTPRMDDELERPPPEMGIEREEWDPLYEKAEIMFRVNDKIFEKSLRQKVLEEELRITGRCARMPIAGQLNTVDKRQIVWSGTDTVLGPLVDKETRSRLNNDYKLQILDQHRCNKLVTRSDDDRSIEYAIVTNLRTKRKVHIKAKHFVVACNPILTPQLLHESGIRPEALGRYLMDQPMSFCQILLSHDIVMKIKAEHERRGAEAAGEDELSAVAYRDPVPIPRSDHPPALILKANHTHPWHAQIHKDTFSYGMVPQSIDPRLVVDLRWFGIMKPQRSNRVHFEGEHQTRDLMNMPQPTFEVSLHEDDKGPLSNMMKEMTDIAHRLGGFLPGAEPRFMPLGTSLHFQGTTRYGPEDNGDSVVDPNGKVWKYSNLYLGGNGIIPTAIACNPTLTSLAFAVRTAREILQRHYGTVDAFPKDEVNRRLNEDSAIAALLNVHEFLRLQRERETHLPL